MIVPRINSLVIIFSLVLSANVVADEKLDMLKNISAAGAPALTLSMIDQAQPKLDEDLFEWILWEQERYTILSQWQQWDDLLLRIEGLPSDLPEQFNQQAATYKIKAYLEIGQVSTARQLLREQLWQANSGGTEEYQTWRRQVITSYLKDDRIEDARIAMLRFNQDFDSEDESWLILRATVLIRVGRYEQAIQILQVLDVWQAELTLLLAQYQSETIDHKSVWDLVNKRARTIDLEPGEASTLWSLGYYAAQQMSVVDRVFALEQLFKTGGRSPLELFQLPVDHLWEAYVEYAQLVGNRAELLVGDDIRWLELAHKANAITPVKARSLYAQLMLQSADKEIVKQAAEGYMLSFESVDESEQNLLNQLFNNSETYSDATSIPSLIRYQLVDLALKTADIEEATRLMSGLSHYPQGTSRFKWQLRQARVLILGGRYEEGNQILASLINEYRDPNAEDTDRILQVLFDLQTVNLHEEAIFHFNQLLMRPIEFSQRREILFWIADSYKAFEKYDQAALLYLQSAMLADPLAMDPWAQTARFSAAESLRKSGLTDDARRIYLELLNVTSEPARRSLLNHNIQQLWLNQDFQ
jgi:hypothetical protein